MDEVAEPVSKSDEAPVASTVTAPALPPRFGSVVSEPAPDVVIEAAPGGSPAAGQKPRPHTDPAEVEAVPVQQSAAAPVRKSNPAPMKDSKAPQAAPVQPMAVPFVFVPVPAPPVPVVAPPRENGGSRTETSAAAPQPQEKTERAPQNDVALQVNIKMPTEQAPPVKQQPIRVSLPETPVSATRAPVASALPAPASAPTLQPAPQARLSPAHEVAAGHAPVPTEPLLKETAQQPLKSLSLEFAPDGAGDVRLRVSERAGEVHISLHSSDASLGGKLHEGVHDLVGSLSKAGYDAEAWTPGQGHQGGNQRQQEQRRQQPQNAHGSGHEFGGFFEQQPEQENS